MSEEVRESPMTSSKPYLVRAFYEWIIDNQCTPYIVVNATAKNVHIPTQYVEDGRIILNVSPLAVKDFLVNNDYIQFNARFSGRIMQVYAPMPAVMAIYARENGRGMVFGDDEEELDDSSPPPDSGGQGGGGKPKLRVIK